MRGLIVKDMLVMRKTLRTYAVFLLFYLVMSALDLFPISFTTAIIQIIIMMLPTGAFSYDEMTKWDRYVMALPVGRRAVVGGRYCFALILALGAALYGLVVSVLLSIFSDQDAMMENLLTVLVSLGIGLLYCDILLPLCYKLGPERARPYMYLVIFLPVILLFGGANAAVGMIWPLVEQNFNVKERRIRTRVDFTAQRPDAALSAAATLTAAQALSLALRLAVGFWKEQSQSSAGDKAPARQKEAV